MSRTMSSRQFSMDVAGHKINILYDNGLYRHIRFRADKDPWYMWFEVVTWPCHLTLAGDMGTWVFSRIDDMFRFFRREDLSINAQYWAEKLEACDRVSGSFEKFDSGAFRRAIIDSLDGYDLEGEAKQRIVSALRADVFDGRDDEREIRERLSDFNCDGFSLSDTWEISGRQYQYRFLWCLYAIVWGIQQYDLRKAFVERPHTPDVPPEPVSPTATDKSSEERKADVK